ncbi:MAG: Ppx/GppA phosphatase family protein [Hyphomonadaceae bacterium]|nr:Ppx/GppA phosphatase family protein [Hyphomonadaceae bacterium]
MDSHSRAASQQGGRARPRPPAPIFAALDLGTNNCRLLLAQPARDGFRVVDGYSQIVRLGEGMAATGRLGDAAMARAYQALGACAQRIEARSPVAVGCIATQACRIAANGLAFLERVRKDFGLSFDIITHEDEAKLSVLGCAGLLDPDCDVALIVDIGGGSTELSWVSPRAVIEATGKGVLDPPIMSWGSAQLGVVTVAEEDPEPETDREAWYERRVQAIADQFKSMGDPALRSAFAAGRAHIVGTSGTVTSLAGVHLGLTRYARSRVDGLWMSAEECRAVIDGLRVKTVIERAANPCIGKDRADLVIPGGAILDAVLRLWPATRIRVADRGLREGVLMRLIAAHRS